MIKTTRSFRGMLCLLVWLLLTLCCPWPGLAQEEIKIPIGGLFSLTGNLQSLGKTSKAAMETAIDDANAMAKAENLPFRFAALIRDTQLNPQQALDEGKKLLADGVKFIIGPQTSAELSQMASFAGGSDILIISPSSTAVRTAAEADHLFRFCPSETIQGLAAATLMKRQGVKVVVPVWQDDAGNDGNQQAMRRAFTALGGKVLEGMKYSAGTQDFYPIVQTLAAQVKKLTHTYGAAHVAVYLAGFDEAVAVLAQAGDHPALSAVPWYGSDGLTMSAAVLLNQRAAAFAAKAAYICPTFGLDNSMKKVWTVLAERIKMRCGLEPDAYSLAVYDAVFVIAKTYVNLSGPSRNIEALRKEFIRVADDHRGVTGKTALSAAGDRKFGSYDFWVVAREDKGYRWKRTCNYDAASSVIFYY